MNKAIAFGCVWVVFGLWIPQAQASRMSCGSCTQQCMSYCQDPASNGSTGTSYKTELQRNMNIGANRIDEICVTWRRPTKITRMRQTCQAFCYRQYKTCPKPPKQPPRSRSCKRKLKKDQLWACDPWTQKQYLFQSRQRFKDGSITIRQYHENGKLMSRTRLDKGKRVGAHMIWFDDGSLYFSCSYLVGAKHGTCTLYFESQRPRREKTYDKGRLHGPQTTWTREGKLSAKYSYRRGKKHGLSQKWEKGVLTFSARYRQGVPHGRHLTCGAYKGRLEIARIYRKGQLVALVNIVALPNQEPTMMSYERLRSPRLKMVVKGKKVTSYYGPASARKRTFKKLLKLSRSSCRQP